MTVQVKKKAAPEIFKADISELRAYLEKQQSEFDKHIEEQRSRERKTMEKGMVYWINT